MPKSINVVRQGSGLFPVTDTDRAELLSLKLGQQMRADLFQQSERSLQHHRLFYGGLVALAMDYYQPKGSLVTEYDKKLVKSTLKIVIGNGLDKETANAAYRHVLERIAASRAEVELTPITKDAFVDWLKIAAGHYNLILLPDGSMLKRPRSINFNSMKQPEFNQFYKTCFDVCWNLIMRSHFDSEEDCQRVIDELMRMG